MDKKPLAGSDCNEKDADAAEPLLANDDAKEKTGGTSLFDML